MPTGGKTYQVEVARRNAVLRSGSRRRRDVYLIRRRLRSLSSATGPRPRREKPCPTIASTRYQPSRFDTFYAHTYRPVYHNPSGPYLPVRLSTVRERSEGVAAKSDRCRGRKARAPS